MARQLTMQRVCTYAVGFFLVGILFPIGLTQIYDANTSGSGGVNETAWSFQWNASVVTVFQVVLPILAIIGIAIDYIRGPS